MKKILLVMGLFGTSLCLDAQTVLTPPNSTNPAPTQSFQFDLNNLKARKDNAGERTPGTFWLNYASSIDQYNGGGAGSTGPAELNSNYLFPDSTVQGEFGTGNFSSVWIHHLGDILDVKSDMFTFIDGVDWGPTDAYQVDSMAIVYAYTRNVSVVDTLVVTLLTNTVASNMPGLYFTGTTAANYSTDTLSFRGLNYSMTTNMITGSGRMTFKIPLDAADEAPTNYIEKAFAIPGGFNVAANRLLGCDIMFKPGYTWVSEDHVDDLNAFLFASYEENGATTFPTFFDCNSLSAACDYNTSFIVPQDVRYGTAGGWNSRFIPSWAYTDAYAFEHHLISYHVTNPIPTGTSIETAAGNDFSLGQNQPNPFKNQTTINYQLKKSADKVSVQVYDVTGSLLFESAGSNLKAGNYSVDLNTAEFASGLYFYSIVVDGVKVTKKMIAE